MQLGEAAEEEEEECAEGDARAGRACERTLGRCPGRIAKSVEARAAAADLQHSPGTCIPPR
jgi:hypothetical protein